MFSEIATFHCVQTQIGENVMVRTRRNALNLIALEDRTNPATATFSAGTLTIIPEQSNFITIRVNASSPFNNTPGYLTASVGATVFFSSTVSQNVKNIVVNGSSIDNFTLSTTAGLDLNSLSIRGSKVSTRINLNTLTLSGNFYYQGSGFGEDNIILLSYFCKGSSTFNLGNGNDRIDTTSMSIGGNLTINGGGGEDSVFLANGEDMSIGGNATFNLGANSNRLVGNFNDTLTVGKNFTYIGGDDIDTIDFQSNSTTLQVGGNVLLQSKSAPITMLNDFRFSSIYAGGTVTYIGGASNDFLEISGPSTIGGNIGFTGYGGANKLSVRNAIVGGSIVQTGASGSDIFNLEETYVGKNVYASLGGDNLGGIGVFGAGMTQQVNVNTNNTIGGNFTILGGINDDSIVLQRTKIGKNLTISTYAGIDQILLDDLDVFGITSINLGDGPDILRVEVDPTALEKSRFSGAFVAYGGNGNDLFNFNLSGTQLIQFGGAVRIFGDGGSDSLGSHSSNIFIQPLSLRFENCENGSF
jgi:hypothetical protein